MTSAAIIRRRRGSTSLLSLYSVLGIRPELAFDFADERYFTNRVPTTFDDAITHTRASTATYVDSNGVLQTAASGVPRVGHHVWNGSAWVNEGLLHESEARTNLLTYSEDLSNAAWNKFKVTVSGNTVIPNTDNDIHELSSSTIVSVTSGQTYIISFEVEASGYDFLQFVISTNLGGAGSFQNFNLANNTLGSGDVTLLRSIVDMGNGVSKISIGVTANGTGNSAFAFGPRPNDGARRAAFAGDGTSGVKINRIQFELGPTPSSYIPTAGTAVTRAADVLTVPAANLPWPAPEVIGPELVTNGDFSDGTTGWSAGGNAVISVSNGQFIVSGDGGFNDRGVQTIPTQIGKVYQVTFDYLGGTSGTTRVVAIQGSGSFLSLNGLTTSTAGTYSFVFVASTATSIIQLYEYGSGGTVIFDNISVREINPLAVSIQMDGRTTYADNDSATEVRPHLWLEDSSNYISDRIQTNSANVGLPAFIQVATGTVDLVNGSPTAYSPGVLVPINIASRHGSTFVNGAVDGVSLTADTTPVALPDLSATDLELGKNYNGTIRTFRIWANDITDAGIEEASA